MQKIEKIGKKLEETARYMNTQFCIRGVNALILNFFYLFVRKCLIQKKNVKKILFLLHQCKYES